jgi:hypothetical protein
MVELAFSFLIETFKKITYKGNLKHLVLMLMVAFSFESYWLTKHIVSLENKINQIPGLIESSQNKLHVQVQREMKNLSFSFGCDLKTIIEYSNASAKEQLLLKKLIDKNSNSILSEIQKIEVEPPVKDSGRNFQPGSITGHRLETSFLYIPNLNAFSPCQIKDRK